jgi:hypothetical protein
MSFNEITNHHRLSKEDKNNVIEDDQDDDIEDDDMEVAEVDDMEVDDIDTEAGTCGSQEDDMTIFSDITDDTEEITPLSFKRKRELITANTRRFPQFVYINEMREHYAPV